MNWLKSKLDEKVSLTFENKFIAINCDYFEK